MSAYFLRDIEKAFECAERSGNKIEVEGVVVGPSIGVAQARVISHLEGNCPCDVDRCPHCKLRPRNSVPRHTPDCQMTAKKQ